jgi:hypothetical protein
MQKKHTSYGARSERRVSRRDLSLYFVHWLTVGMPRSSHWWPGGRSGKDTPLDDL